MELLHKLYEMTAIGNIVASPEILIMFALGFVLLYLGIVKKYEPLLLVPIAFGVIIANFPLGQMGVAAADHVKDIFLTMDFDTFYALPLAEQEALLQDSHSMNLFEIANRYGIMNFLYYSLLKTGLLPPLIFLGVGAMTDFGPMLRNLR